MLDDNMQERMGETYKEIVDCVVGVTTNKQRNSMASAWN